MEFEHVKSIEGSPRPSNIFEPHMPGVELMSDMDLVFETARNQAANYQAPDGKTVNGQRALAIITPGRLIMLQPCPPPGSMEDIHVTPIKTIMPPDPPLKISVISYTLLEAFMEDVTKTKCIPFLGTLLGFSYIGHNVIVFEGHSSAFESGVRNSDVLVVDSGMLPFIRTDWVDAAQRVMPPNAKVFVSSRERNLFIPVAKSTNAQGWRYSEYDGEVSYTNCLLTTLARGSTPSAKITSGLPLPDLADLTTNPDQLDWIAGLPFKYAKLDADEVMKCILNAAGWRWFHFFKSKGVFHARLAVDGKLKPVSFTLTLTKDSNGNRQLQIER